jgi:hypothetical protein
MVPFLAYLSSDDAADITGHLFKLAADGEIGLWSDPQLVNQITAANGTWTMVELAERVPNELLANAKNLSVALPMS